MIARSMASLREASLAPDPSKSHKMAQTSRIGGNVSARPDLSSLRPFFEPKSFAIVGASTDAQKVGGRPLALAKASGYEGRVFPINKGAAEVQGLKAYPSVRDVDAPIDCAFMAIPAQAVEEALLECAEAGVRSVVCVSAGMAEIGGEGVKRQNRMTAIARESGMRIVGPNCLGVFDVGHKFYATFAAGFLDPSFGFPTLGPMSIVSQSGAFGMHAYTLAKFRGLSVSSWVTTGNEADVEFGECLSYLADDPQTRVILAYLEGARDKDSIVEGLEKARRAEKPVIVLKVGRSAIGSVAASSHTGSLVGEDTAYDALFKQYGAYRAETISELIDVAAACCAGRFPASPDVGTISISGGANVIMADAAAEVGVNMPALPKAAQEKIGSYVPYAATRNPLDTTGMWSGMPELFPKFMDVLVEDGKLPSVVVFGSTMGTNEPFYRGVIESLKPIRERHPDKLLIMSAVCPPAVREYTEKAGFLVFEDADRAIRVIGALHGFAKAWKRKATAPALPKNLPRLAESRVGEAEALGILEAAGVPVVAHHLCDSPDEAATACAAFKFPAVLKIASPDIIHKTEMGGVMLGIDSREAAERAYRTLVSRARKAAPKARIDGVVAMKQVQGGVETILGAHNDPALGPVVMFGLGGIFVEVFKDVAFRLAPIGLDEARAMIREVKGHALLAGARGRKAADADAIAKALVRLSLLAAANADRFESIDVNPFIVGEKGKGAVAVDAVIVPKKR
jgi:acetate---CoA ligase (ADP-forming)